MSLLNLQGNWVDLVIIAFLFIYTVIRVKKGFVDSLFDLIGFLLSMIVAVHFYSYGSALIRHFISIAQGFANAIGFFLVATITEIIISTITLFSERFIPEKLQKSKINHYLGIVPSFLSGLILVIFFLVAVIALPVQPGIKQDVLNSQIGKVLTQHTFGIENDVNHVFGGAVQDAMKFLTVEPEGNETIHLKFKTNNFSPDPSSEKEMFQLLNKERTSRGIPSLTFDVDLRSVGRAHCEDMFRRGYFSHYTPEGLSPFDRMKNAGIIYTSAGENLAYAPDVITAHQGLMNSPGHRANILSRDFGKVGIGVINAGIYGRMFCQEFTN